MFFLGLIVPVFPVPIVLKEITPKSSVVVTGYTFDGEGNLYVAYHNGSIFKFSDGKASLLVQFPAGYRIRGLVLDHAGYLYTGSYIGQVFKIGADGSYTVFASGLWSIQGMVFDEKGDLYVSAAATYEIYKITPEGNKTLFMSIGNSSKGYAISLALDSAGKMYIMMVSDIKPPLFTYIVRVSLSNSSLRKTILYLKDLRAYDNQGLYVRADGKLLVAGVFNHYSDDKSGVYLVDPETGNYEYYVEPKSGLRLLSVVPDSENNIYVKGQWKENDVSYYSIFSAREGSAGDSTPVTGIWFYQNMILIVVSAFLLILIVLLFVRRSKARKKPPSEKP
ncbi:MAG: hypothetical protein DRJ47_10455 [Thermoprotei archaeon]|nr:MAG: hypothetical protein DRJ47_10455 [Thermoprotei archaeon]